MKTRYCTRFSRSLLGILLSLQALNVPGQIEDNGFAWVKTGGGPQNDAGTGLTVDAATNVIAVGTYSNVVAFSGITLTNAGNKDFFIASYRRDGELNWIQRAGGALDDGAGGASADTNGFIYATGFFRGQARFGQTLLSARGTSSALDAFLVKYSPTGALQWVQQAGGPGDDRGHAVAADPGGGCWVAGSFSGTAIFGPNVQLVATNSQVPETFVARYQTNGSLSWVKRFGSNRGLIGYAIQAGPNGRAVLGGEFAGTAEFGTNSFISAGDRDAFVVSLNAQGEAEWAFQLGGGSADGGRGLGIDAGGNVYVGGYFSDTFRWGGATVSSAGRKDVFLACLTSLGVPTWIQTGGGTEDDSFNSVTVSTRGAIYAGGSFSTSLRIAGVTLASVGNLDGFLTRFDRHGTLDWMARCGGSATAADSITAIAAGPGNSLFATGEFSGNATFGTNSVSTSGAINRDFFLTERRVRPPDVPLSPTNTVATLGEPFTLSVTASGSGPFTYQWYLNQVALAGETNAVLTRTNTTLADAGSYEVTVGSNESEYRSPPAEVSLEVKLSLQTQGNGQILADPILDRYPLGSTVQLYGLAEDDAFFVRWSGDLESHDNPAQLQLNGNRSVRGIFGSRRLQLVAMGSGTIKATPAQELYAPGEAVILTAEAGKSYSFTGWDDGDARNPRPIVIGETNRYTALFTNLVPVETLVFGSVTRTAQTGMPALFVDNEFIVDGPVLRGDEVEIRLYSSFTNGTVVYSLDGSTPNRRFEGPFRVARSVQIQARAYSEDFLEEVSMDAIQLLIVPSFQIQATTTGGGTVTISPLQERYLSNTLVTITATPTNGWTFLGWAGDLGGHEATNLVHIDRDRCGQAIFGTTLALTNAGAGRLVAEPNLSTFPYGSTVRITAFPEAGNQFVSWGGAGSGAVNPLVLQITRTNPTVRALFLSSGNDFPLVVEPTGAGSVVVFPRQNLYTNGQSVLLIASPEAGQEFLGWTGDVEASTNRLTLRMTQRSIIQARFTSKPSLKMIYCLNPKRAEDLRLEIQSDLGASLSLERSQNLTSWTSWLTLTNTLGYLLVPDPEASGGAGFFHRAVRTGP
ncbi:MAG: immunoglobulin domain-containing protein [Verrucomicrobiales bacterium]|nr:immunoglobulin domain-containing protein [Verrucomicrobiales bacterium]